MARAGRLVADAAFLNNTPKYVVSSTLAELDWSGSTLLGADLAAELTALKGKPGKNIHIPAAPGWCARCCWRVCWTSSIC
ncbi:hypothetical protein ACFPN7_07205 [Amycolatopsis halotolerans]|uniref:hypothetical protein n=1 Tax=Amycolatopsis halotolerans TaxID=330083 RepID=UPI00360C5D54